MSLIDSASLIVTPNAYSEGKLYSVIPSDGSGDMSVVRATTATRVNSAGLVELVPYNLLTYSEQFDNAAWTKVNANITANAAIAPDGTMTADNLSFFGGNTSKYLSQSNTLNGTYSQSVYLKYNNQQWFQLFQFGDGSFYANFDIQNGTLGSYTGCTPSIENVGNGWYRCNITFTSSTAFQFVIWQINNGTSGRSTTSTPTGSVYAWGAQLVEGTNALDYQKTETRLNIPRLDYSNGTCPSLLVEPQRTNLALYSSSFDNAAWTKTSAGTGSNPVITANYATSPDGTQNADLVVFNRGAGNSSSDFSWLYQTIVTSTTTYTISCYVKAATSADVGKNLAWRNFGGGTAWDVNLSSEWQRITIQANGSGTTQEIGFYNRGGYSTGNSVSVLMWGFQAEVGSYATSIIPTTSASVTRNADVISKTGISSLIGQTEGTLFWEGQGNTQSTGDDLWILGASVNDTSTAVLLYYIHSTATISCFINNGSSFVVLDAPMTITDNNKVAIGYKSGDFVMYVNGAQVDSNTSATAIPSTMNQVAFNKWQGATGVQKQSMKAAALWKTRLTNDELERLTGTGFNTYAEMANYYNYITQ